MDNTTKKVRAALAALAPFGRLDADTALILLSCWKGRHELSAADLSAVRAVYAGGAR
ncbi:hypothetical protein [Actinoplanes subglobosus]|uniref:Uncharacterized protein n=1 Tax=Actinoplanes subglobosus TaxID=1547892 RepID=A0ABV8IWB9_9ACTN